MTLPSRTSWNWGLISILMSVAALQLSHARKSKFIAMDDSRYCDGETHSVDGAVVSSSSASMHLSEMCTVRLKAEGGFRNNLMVAVRAVNIGGCHVSLNFYDGHTTYGPPDKVLDCHSSNRSDHGDEVFFVRSSYLTIQLLHRRNDSLLVNFTVVVTAFREMVSCTNSRFHCLSDARNICIDRDLLCDGVDNCQHGSDEAHCTKISGDTDLDVREEGLMTTSLMLLLVLAPVLLLITCLIAVTLYCCRPRRARGRGRGRPQGRGRERSRRRNGGSVGGGIIIPPLPADNSPTYPAVGVPPGTQPAYQSDYTRQFYPAEAPGGYYPVPTAPPVNCLYPPPSYAATCPPGLNAPLGLPLLPPAPTAPPAPPGYTARALPVNYHRQSGNVRVPVQL